MVKFMYEAIGGKIHVHTKMHMLLQAIYQGPAE